MSNLPRNGRPYAKLASQLFAWACAACAFSSIAILALLLSQMLYFAWGWLDWQFLTSFDSQLSPHKAGVRAALVGSIYLILLTTLFAVPIGVGAAIYLEEYAQRSRWRGIVQTNIANLAGVPSIVYGILGLGLFVRGMQMGAGVLAGALTLTLVVLPIVILASQEALRAVPSTIRQASYALGATKLDVTVGVIVPAALSGIMASFILAIARAVGETMAVALAAGKRPQMTLNPLDSIQTMTAYIVETSKGDNPQGTLGYQTIFAVGLTLFLCTLALNVLAQWILKRMREQYE